MLRTTIKDARGTDVPLVKGPRRRDWPRHSFFGASRQIAAHGEPWITELDITRKWAGSYGATIGLLIVVELVAYRALISHGMFGLSLDATASLLCVLTTPLFWLLAPLFAATARKANAGKLEAAYLAAHRCPSCGADLASTDRAGEQRTCPSCRALWAAQSPMLLPAAPHAS